MTYYITDDLTVAESTRRWTGTPTRHTVADPNGAGFYKYAIRRRGEENRWVFRFAARTDECLEVLASLNSAERVAA